MDNYSVYVLIFPNNKMYFSITRREPEQRWREGQGYCGQMVYKAISKYGWSNTKHIILFKGLSKEEACEAEGLLIQDYRTTDIRFGYNLGEGGSCGCCASGKRHWNYNKTVPESTRKKISNTLMGRYVGKNNPHHTPVIQFTLENEYLRTWDSLADIQRSLGYDHAHIVDCCRGRRNKAYGYKWRYVDEKINKEKL